MSRILACLRQASILVELYEVDLKRDEHPELKSSVETGSVVVLNLLGF